MFERFTDRSRRVLVLAQEEARELNHDFIGTEHILLGLIREHDGIAAKALDASGVAYTTARAKVEEITGIGDDSSPGAPPFTKRAKNVLERALREALQFGHTYIGTEHLLLGIVRVGEGGAITVVTDLGVDPSDLHRKVIELMSSQSGREVAGTPDQTPPLNSGVLRGVVRAVGQQLRPDLDPSTLAERVSRIADELFDQLRKSWAEEDGST
ncbi:MAG: Clp protease N-terminal domain-containing protein [Acidimicrobiales bacterium]|jgi:ATP-dependent Clp protease ATP-binding subunit ClpC